MTHYRNKFAIEKQEQYGEMRFIMKVIQEPLIRLILIKNILPIYLFFLIESVLFFL